MREPYELRPIPTEKTPIWITQSQTPLSLEELADRTLFVVSDEPPPGIARWSNSVEYNRELRVAIFGLRHGKYGGRIEMTAEEMLHNPQMLLTKAKALLGDFEPLDGKRRARGGG